MNSIMWNIIKYLVNKIYINIYAYEKLKLYMFKRKEIFLDILHIIY